MQTLTDASGTEFEAFELPFTLNVLARQGAMSQAQVQQVVADHKNMVGVRLATAPTHGVRCFSCGRSVVEGLQSTSCNMRLCSCALMMQ